MPIPIEKDIEIYLLHEIEARGGSVRPREVYEAVARHFLQMTSADLTLNTVGSGANRWSNRVQWVRNDLVKKGELDGSQRGVWRITQKGRKRLLDEWPPTLPPKYSEKLYTDRPRYVRAPAPNRAPLQAQPAQASLAPTLPSQGPGDVQDSVREQILAKLRSMTDKQFENFVGQILTELGYEDVDVVGRPGDGGVDVKCVIKASLIEPPVTVVCQVKRHASNVQPSAVGDLRGRWAHRADRLILVNTGGFTPGAREAAKEPGAKEISLVSGEDLADLMIQQGLGITRRPVVEEKLDETFFNRFS